MRGAEVETTFTASLCLMTRDQQRSAQTWLPDSSDIELNTDRPHSSAVGPRFARQGSRLGPGNMKSNSGRTRDYLSDYVTQRYRVLQHTVLHCFLLTLVTRTSSSCFFRHSGGSGFFPPFSLLSPAHSVPHTSVLHTRRHPEIFSCCSRTTQVSPAGWLDSHLVCHWCFRLILILATSCCHVRQLRKFKSGCHT